MTSVDIILKYFDNLSEEQKEQLSALKDLYTDWNSKINVISRKDIEELYTRHVLHSLSIAKFISFTPGTDIIDVGCGGGFPGIPLAILFPQVKFTLVDSIGKKINVVNNVISALGITNASGINDRAENLNYRYDFIISRAVTAFPDFVDLTGKLVSKKQRNAIPNGIIYLKGGDFGDEIKRYQKVIEVLDIIRYFDEPYFETKKIIYLPL